MRPLILLCLSAVSAFSQPGLLGQKASLRYGLTGWWTMNEAAGTSAGDYSGNANSAAFTASPTWGAGVVGAALSFNGSTSYVNAPAGMNVQTNWTVALWLKVAAYPASGIACMISDWSQNTTTSSGGDVLMLWINTTGHPAGSFHTTGSSSFGNSSYNDLTASSTVFSTNVWYHYAAVRTGTNIALYINGAVDTPNAGLADSNPMVTSTRVRIGSQNSGGQGRFFNGAEDDVRIYNRALAASEVKQLYGGGYGCP